MRPTPSGLIRGTSSILGMTFVLFLCVPILAVLAAGGRDGLLALAHDEAVRESLVLTLLTATGATLLGVLGGSPIAYLLARRRFRGRTLLAAVIDIPLLIPHPVAGIALLLFLGRDTMVGRAIAAIGLRIVGSPAGIIAAMVFVAAPLYVSAAREAFAKVDPDYERVARTLGASPARVLRRVTVPLAGRGLLSAAVVMWSRAISEFGAVVVLTYNPQVVSVLSYDRLTTHGLVDVLPVAAVLIVVSMAPLIVLRGLRYERDTETAL